MGKNADGKDDTMADLLDRLKAYGPLYPMHMPGHKRRLGRDELPFSWDMTEVEGVDDLHEAQGILKEAMDRTAALHGAEKTWYLVGGSTCGLLAGIRALAPDGSGILVGRNCHKSVYHAIELGHLQAHYLTPPVDPRFSVYGSISPGAVEKALEEFPGCACVVITSPTYEGVISDVRGIAEVCRRRGIPLLVDEAHGAHLGLFPGWPDSAVRCGADLVVESAHKTLPSLTQTALLHLPAGSLADPQEVERQLDIFETSSPSYPLMASLDSCTSLLLSRGEELFRSWLQTLWEYDQKVKDLRHLRALGHSAPCPQFFGFDPGKLPVFTGGTQFTGASLAQALRSRFGFETEMACGHLCLGMTSPADDREAVLRFADALLALDRECQARPRPAPTVLPAPGPVRCTIARALSLEALELPMEAVCGRIAAEALWAYPPGVPLIAPGEQITEEFLSCCCALIQSGTGLHHSHCKKPGFFRVLA